MRMKHEHIKVRKFMKKPPFLVSAIAINILFLFLYIHQASRYMDASYHAQELLKTKKKLELAKQTAHYQLETAQMSDAVNRFASDTLHMVPMRIGQAKKIPHE